MSVVTASLLPDPPRRLQNEALLQKSVHQFLGWAEPGDALHFAIPNGLMRSQQARARAQGEGVKAGIPDLCVIFRGRVIFIELKSRTGSLSPAQRATHNKLRYCGAEVITCRSLECVETSLRELGVPLRATVSGWQSERLA